MNAFFERLKSKGGFTLLNAIVAGTISLIFLLVFSKMLFSTGRAERGLASNLDLTEVTSVVRMILERKESCDRSGLVGLIIHPGSPDANAIELKLPGETTPFLKENEHALGARMVEKLRVTKMHKEQDLPGGRALYFSTITLITAVEGNVETQRNPKRTFSLRLVLNAATDEVLECFSHLHDLGPLPRNDYILITNEENTDDRYADEGSYTEPTWRKRKLNALKVDTGGNVTLHGNWEFTLAPGTYQCSISVPMMGVHEFIARLWNVTTSTEVAIGTTMHTHAASNSSNILVRLTPSAPTRYRVENRAAMDSQLWENSGANAGHGTSLQDFGAKAVFSTVSCERVL